MRREDLFMDILGGLDEKYVAAAMPSGREVSPAPADTETPAYTESAEVSKRDVRIYMAVRALGLAAAVVLVVGAAVLLIKNWDKIAVREPDRPGVITTVSEPVVTTADSSGSKNSIVSFDEIRKMLFYNDKNIILPCTVSDILALDSRFTIGESTEDENGSFTSIMLGNELVCSLTAAKSGTDVDIPEGCQLVSLAIRKGDHFSLFGGKIKPGTTIDEIKSILGEPVHNDEYPDYSYKFESSGNTISINDLRFDDDGKLIQMPDICYIGKNPADPFGQITDTSMPEPFAPAETNFGAWKFSAQWDRKFGNHYSAAEIYLIDLAAPADRDRYNKAAEITHETPYMLDDSANDYNHARIMGLEGDALAEMIKKRNEEYSDNHWLTEYRYRDEETELLTSGTRAQIIEHFRSDLAIVVGENVFSPMWLYYHTDEDYRAAGITGVRITEMIPYYKFAFRENTTGSRMTDEAWEAFYSKLSNYADTETNTVREQIEYAELPVPWKYYRNIQDNELDSLVYNFLLENQEQIELFRRLYLWGCDAPGTQYLTRRYPDAENPEQEYQYRMQDSSVLPFGTIEEFREWMHEYFSDGVCERYSLQMFDGWYQDGYYVPPYFIEENGKLYRYCMIGNPKCEMDYKTAKVIDMDIWRISDDGWRSIVDGTLFFACIGPENKLPALEYTAYYGTIEIKDGKPKLGFVPGVWLFEYHGETTGEIEGIWREKTNEDMKKKYEQLAGALIGQQRTELSLVDNSSGFGEAGLRIFEDAFYGEWEPETEPYEKNIMLTYKLDMFSFENFAYPSYIAETDELWVLAYINGGAAECCVVRRDDPDTLYRGWWEKAEDPDANDTLITYNNRGIYRKKNDFILERGFRAGDTVSRFGLYKLMTQYNSEIWGKFCAEIGFKWPYALDRAVSFTDSEGEEWTTACTASLPSRVMYYIGGNYTDNITLAVRFFNKKEYDLYVGNNYSSAYEPKEHYFALTLSTDENNIASVEYRPMDEMYREYDKMTFGSDDAGKYSVKLVCHDIKTVFGSLRFASAEIELRSGDELIASKSFSTPFVGLNEMSCLNNDDINIRVFEGGKDHALIAVMLPEENDDRKFYITTLYWYNGTELNELDRFPELLSPDDLVFDENEILRYTDMNGENHAYAVSESGTWLMRAG